jgi:hypothetical protein
MASNAEVDVTKCPDCDSPGKYESRILIGGRGFYTCTNETCGARWQDLEEKRETCGVVPLRGGADQ